MYICIYHMYIYSRFFVGSTQMYICGDFFSASTATRYNALQQNATHCNALQHTSHLHGRC